MYKEEFMKRAVELSRVALREPGAGPYGSVVVRGGKLVGEGYNQAVMRCDPTSHSEVEAIRDACAKLQTLDLSDYQLYTSAQPCSMCQATIAVARVGQVYVASQR